MPSPEAFGSTLHRTRTRSSPDPNFIFWRPSPRSRSPSLVQGKSLGSHELAPPRLLHICRSSSKGLLCGGRPAPALRFPQLIHVPPGNSSNLGSIILQLRPAPRPPRPEPRTAPSASCAHTPARPSCGPSRPGRRLLASSEPPQQRPWNPCSNTSNGLICCGLSVPDVSITQLIPAFLALVFLSISH